MIKCAICKRDVFSCGCSPDRTKRVKVSRALFAKAKRLVYVALAKSLEADGFVPDGIKFRAEKHHFVYLVSNHTENLHAQNTMTWELVHTHPKAVEYAVKKTLHELAKATADET